MASRDGLGGGAEERARKGASEAAESAQSSRRQGERRQTRGRRNVKREEGGESESESRGGEHIENESRGGGKEKHIESDRVGEVAERESMTKRARTYLHH